MRLRDMFVPYYPFLTKYFTVSPDCIRQPTSTHATVRRLKRPQ